MKLYDKNLRRIRNDERKQRMLDLGKRNIQFLVTNYGISKVFLMTKLGSLSVVEKEGKSHFVEYNGRREEIKDGGPASFVTKKSQQYDGNKWFFEVAIYTADNNGDHTIAHELYHYFSENAEMEFNENGIGYDKRRSSYYWI